MSDSEDIHYDQGDHFSNSYDKAYNALKTDMTLDKDKPFDKSVRGYESSETMKAGRKNSDQ